MTETERLAACPCPFCGSADTKPRKDDVAYLPPAIHYVLCGCGASGANVESEAEAITAWNRRAPVSDIDTIARALCRERCSFMGEPPCFQIGPWPNPQCNEPGCMAEAEAVLAAITADSPPPSPERKAE